MKSLSLEWVIFVLFRILLLIQWAIRLLRGRGIQVPTDFAERAIFLPPDLPPVMSVWSAGVTNGASVQVYANVSSRFSRGVLLGNRRMTQNAVVVAAILGRCHAYRH